MLRISTISAVSMFLLSFSDASLGQIGESGRPQPSTKSLHASSVDPRLFGTQDYTITVIHASQFNGNTAGYLDPVTLSKVSSCEAGPGSFCVPLHWYAGLDLPAGAIVDYIGVNNTTTVDGFMGLTLHFRDHLGGHAPLASFSFPAHAVGAFATDFAGPLGILVPGNHDRSLILDVERGASVGGQVSAFAYVEIWWRRSVSDPPATPTFGDVPASHPFYRFVEALAASGITAGCGGGNYCPGQPLTRGEMAVFLSVALGLHWPN